jgi:hypothetical protein
VRDNKRVTAASVYVPESTDVAFLGAAVKPYAPRDEKSSPDHGAPFVWDHAGWRRAAPLVVPDLEPNDVVPQP